MKKLNSGLVLIKVDQAEEQVDGVYIMEEWMTNPPTGIVDSVADDVTFCQPGDRVFFERYTSIPTIEKNYRLCREDAVFINYEK